MWEHPFDKKRRLERTAFSQAINNKLPRNMVNKIFGYKEIMNELSGYNTPGTLNNARLSKMAHWIANAPVQGMNSSEKLRALRTVMNEIGHLNFPYSNREVQKRLLDVYIDNLKFVNSKEKLKNLLSFVQPLSGFDRRYMKYIGLTSSKFFNLNTPTRRKVLNLVKDIRYPGPGREIIAIIGNRQEMIKAIRNDLNYVIKRKQNVVKRNFGNAPAVTETNRKVKERIDRELREARKRKRNLNNMSTGSLKKLTINAFKAREKNEM
jgi:hypothetical protein